MHSSQGSRSIPLVLAALAAAFAGRQELRAQTSDGGIIEPVLPAISVYAPDAAASERGPDKGLFHIVRQGPTNAEVRVPIRMEGSASNGLDYAALPDHVVFRPGMRRIELPLVPVDDPAPEPIEVATLVLIPPPSISSATYRVVEPRRATVAITDNDAPPPPTNQPPRAEIVTPKDGQSFPAPASFPIAAAASDIDGKVRRVDFYSGTNWIGMSTGSVIAVTDGTTIWPPYWMVWTNVPAGAYELRARATDDDGAAGWSRPVRVLVVAQPPVPCVSIKALDPIAAEGTNFCRWTGWPRDLLRGPESATNTACFAVFRFGPTNTPLTVRYLVGGTASNGVDYAALPAQVALAAGQRMARIPVVPFDDGEIERLETVILRLTEPPTASVVPPYRLAKPWQAGAVIVDNDRERPVCGVLPDQCIHLQRPGTNGGLFVVEISTNLIDWSVLCTNEVTDGAMHFVDPDAPPSTRYYRLRPMPAAGIGGN